MREGRRRRYAAGMTKPSLHRASAVLTIACAVALIATACGKDDDKKSGKKTGGDYEFGCKIFIKQKSSAKPIKGKVKTGLEDEAKAKAEALKSACDQLPEAERASCPDKAKYKVQWVSASMSSNGKKFFSPNVTLKPKLAEHRGKGTSEASSDEACKAAIAAACKAAGATGDCIKSGKWEKTGQGTSKKMKGI